MTIVPAGTPQTISLPAGQVLTVTTDAQSAGRVWPFSDKVGDTSGVNTMISSATLVLGPYAGETRYQIEATAGALVYAVDAVAMAPRGKSPVAISPPSDFVELFGSGAPVDGVQASVTINPTGNDNSLTFIAVEHGAGGNDYSVAYVDPGANSSPLSLSVAGVGGRETGAFTVNLETDGSGDIVTTAADIVALVEADPRFTSVATVEIHTGDSGSADDGSGVVTAMAADNFENGAGTGVGVAGTGSRYTRTSNGALYTNQGTLADPAWVQLLSFADL